jgi:hypothetical protein
MVELRHRLDLVVVDRLLLVLLLVLLLLLLAPRSRSA